VTRGRRNLAVVIGLGLVVLACGEGSGSGTDGTAPLETSGAATTAETGLPSCRDAGRAIVFSVFGAATTGAADATTWMDDPLAEPVARPGAAAVATAYRDAGYEVVYAALLPSEAAIGDRPVPDAVTVWLGLNGFPVGDGVRVWAPEGDGAADPSVALIEELARMGAAGTVVDAGYAGDQETVFPLVAGGIADDQVFLVGDGGDAEATGPEVSSTPLPDDDLTAHVGQIRALDPICE
jgi:hypothetical protein